MSVKIVPFKTTDTQEVVEIWEKELPNPEPQNVPMYAIQRKLAQDDGLFFVAKEASKVVGTVAAGYDGIRGWIYHLVVQDDRRAQGIGKQLVQHAEKILSTLGCPKVNLQIRETNLGVIQFYEKLGYSNDEAVSYGKQLKLPKSTDYLYPVPTLEVDNEIVLSQVTWGDHDSHMKQLNQTDQINKYIDEIPYPYTEDDERQWLYDITNRCLDASKEIAWAIRLSETGESIGECWLTSIERNKRAEVGYWISKDYWGQGITSKAVKRIAQYAFEELACQKAYATIRDGNEQSKRVLEKAGFEFEATLKKHTMYDGVTWDVHFFGLWK